MNGTSLVYRYSFLCIATCTVEKYTSRIHDFQLPKVVKNVQSFGINNMIKSELLTWNTLPTQAFIQSYEHIGIEIFNALHSARYCELSQNGVGCLNYTYNNE